MKIYEVEVVICLKFTTFVVATTVNSQNRYKIVQL